jgi:hypothetical protein
MIKPICLLNKYLLICILQPPEVQSIQDEVDQIVYQMEPH